MEDYDLALLIIGDYELTRRKMQMEIQRLQAEVTEKAETRAEQEVE